MLAVHRRAGEEAERERMREGSWWKGAGGGRAKGEEPSNMKMARAKQLRATHFKELAVATKSCSGAFLLFYFLRIHF